MTENWQIGGFGIYLHWPYCESKCPYCDFNSYVAQSIDHDRWCAAFLNEIDRYADLTPDRVLRSVYFGGGTPSLMQPKMVAAILDRISLHWTISNEIEITLEANPTSIEINKFKAFKESGINRTSIGVQALNNDALRLLGRLHSGEEALQAIEIGKQVFDKVSFDLIYARQFQTQNEWETELDLALSFDPDHLSLYQLTIEPETVFGARHAVGNLKGLPDEDLQADMYEYTQIRCQNADLPAYEISNHAKPGYESEHNQIYWNGGDYIGIGPGAHGRLTLGKDRYGTEGISNPNNWLRLAESLTDEADNRYKLSNSDVYNELIMMGLRTTTGIDVDRLNKLCGNSFTVPETLIPHKVLEIVNDRLQTTSAGRPILNHVIKELLI